MYARKPVCLMPVKTQDAVGLVEAHARHQNVWFLTHTCCSWTSAAERASVSSSMAVSLAVVAPREPFSSLSHLEYTCAQPPSVP